MQRMQSFNSSFEVDERAPGVGQLEMKNDTCHEYLHGLLSGPQKHVRERYSDTICGVGSMAT